MLRPLTLSGERYLALHEYENHVLNLNPGEEEASWNTGLGVPRRRRRGGRKYRSDHHLIDMEENGSLAYLLQYLIYF